MRLLPFVLAICVLSTVPASAQVEDNQWTVKLGSIPHTCAGEGTTANGLFCKKTLHQQVSNTDQVFWTTPLVALASPDAPNFSPTCFPDVGCFGPYPYQITTAPTEGMGYSLTFSTGPLGTGDASNLVITQGATSTVHIMIKFRMETVGVTNCATVNASVATALAAPTSSWAGDYNDGTALTLVEPSASTIDAYQASNAGITKYTTPAGNCGYSANVVAKITGSVTLSNLLIGAPFDTLFDTSVIYDYFYKFTNAELGNNLFDSSVTIFWPPGETPGSISWSAPPVYPVPAYFNLQLASLPYTGSCPSGGTLSSSGYVCKRQDGRDVFQLATRIAWEGEYSCTGDVCSGSMAVATTLLQGVGFEANFANSNTALQVIPATSATPWNLYLRILLSSTVSCAASPAYTLPASSATLTLTTAEKGVLTNVTPLDTIVAQPVSVSQSNPGVVWGVSPVSGSNCILSIELTIPMVGPATLTNVEFRAPLATSPFFGLSDPTPFTWTMANRGISFLVDSTNTTGASAMTVDVIPYQPLARLGGRPSFTKGQLELYDTTTSSYATACITDLTVSDAIVACRTMGLPSASATIKSFGEVPNLGAPKFGSLNCAGNEATIADCSYASGSASANCLSAGIVCLAAPAGTTQGDLSLIGGTTSRNGRLGLWYDDEWSSVCAENFNDADGIVACRQLGYTSVEQTVITTVYTGGQLNTPPSLNPIVLQGMDCSSTPSAATLLGCNHGTLGQSGTCVKPWDAMLQCNLPPSNDPVVTTLLSEQTFGVIEARIDDPNAANLVVGFICTSGFDSNAAKVVCREHGLPTTHARSVSSSGTFPLGVNGTIIMSNIVCTGVEDALTECTYSQSAGTCVGEADYAAVVCTDIPVQPLTGTEADYSLRLVDGVAGVSGSLQMIVSGTWGPVCAQFWTQEPTKFSNPTVACRQLGLGTSNAATINGYGSAAAPVMGDIQCAGTEASLFACDHQLPGVCQVWEQVAVTCGGSTVAALPPAPTVSQIPCNSPCGDIILGGEGATATSGRIQPFYEGQMGTVCADGFDIEDAIVACRQLGIPTDSPSFELAEPTFGVLNSTIPIWMADLSCTGSEARLQDCPFFEWGVNSCAHTEDIAISCVSPSTASYPFATGETGSVRLVGGPDHTEGRVEILVNNVWGTACSQGWLFGAPAPQVLCRQLGLNWTDAIGIEGTYANGTGPIQMSNTMCLGTELTILDCPHDTDPKACEHLLDVGVQCRGSDVAPEPILTYIPQACSPMSSAPSLVATPNEPDGTFRLVGCTETFEGNLEMSYNGTWGSVCDDVGFGINDGRANARVICNAMGLPSSEAIALSLAPFPSPYLVTPDFVLDDVECWGNENDVITECRHFPLGSSDCASNEVVGLMCLGVVESFGAYVAPSSRVPVESTLAPIETIPAGTLRLAGGANPSEGYLEILQGGFWGTVCDDGWFDASDNSTNPINARVACFQMGLPSTDATIFTAQTVPNSAQEFGPQPNTAIYLANVQCNGAEFSLLQCQHTNGDSCTHEEDVALRCGGELEPSIRAPLVTTPGPLQSTVEANPTLPAGTVRLVNGPSPNTGTVEVVHNGQWGTVCGDYGSQENAIKIAQVICDQLGLPATQARMLQPNPYPPVQDYLPIWIDDAVCNGFEASISDCQHAPFGVHDCIHVEDAAVECLGEVFPSDRMPPTTQAAETTFFAPVVTFGVPGTLRLVDGGHPSEGILEVFLNNTWGTVCDDGWGPTQGGFSSGVNAEIVCHQLGFGATDAMWGSSALFGEGVAASLLLPINLQGAACNGAENELIECAPLNSVCSHSEDVAVKCGGAALASFREPITTQIAPEMTSVKPCVNPGNNGNARLVGGAVGSEGLLEVYYCGEWGSVCDDGFSNENAEVICNQLGFTDYVATWSGSASFGQSSGPIVLDDVTCSGHEASLLQCVHSPVFTTDCSHSEDVSIVCTVPTTHLGAAETSAAVASSIPGTSGFPVPSGTEFAVVDFHLNNYAPQQTVVRVGTLVTWVNTDSTLSGISHQIFENTGLFTSKVFAPGETWSYLFETAGTFPYTCLLHPQTMTGSEIVVTPDGTVALEGCSSSPCQNSGFCIDLGGNSILCACTNPDYTGAFCESLIDPCDPNPCQGGGTCTSTSATAYTCQCPSGFVGAVCSINANECTSNPCNNGVCTDGVDGYTCTCHTGFTGAGCLENIDDCVSSPCANGGTCNDGINEYGCSCTLGFQGTHCDQQVIECSSNPCMNGGTCSDGTNSYTCTCAPGFTGVTCAVEVIECGSSPCQNGATCVDSVNTYTCQCVPGYVGRLCDQDIDECLSLPCQNGGTCTDVVNGFACSCPTGFAGFNCGQNINECASQPCRNGGTCLDGIDRFTCNCAGTGFGGATCDAAQDACSSNPCSNAAQCTSTLGVWSCDCTNTGFSGATCSVAVNECASSPCANAGTCFDHVNSYACACVFGYAGANCLTNVDDCVNSPCANGGTCVDGINSVVCTCAAGFTGTLCNVNIDECASSPCHNQGVCTDGNNKFTCDCSSTAFGGTLCDQASDACSSNPCLNSGVCSTATGSWQCDCAGTGFTGTSCAVDIDECASSPCEHGSTCSNLVNAFACICTAGYAGASCQVDVDECLSAPCRNVGTCVDGVNGFTCVCAAGFSGSMCAVNVDECNSQPCQNGAACVDGIDRFTCNCAGTGFGGGLCDVQQDQCASQPCANGGACSSVGPTYLCNCANTGFSGTNCEVDSNECASQPCLNGATCVDNANAWSCVCASGFGGVTCAQDLNECQSTPCRNGATCVDAVNGYSCTCVAGFTGSLCQADIDECVSQPCENGATCQNGVGQFECFCAAGFSGVTCASDNDECLSMPCRNQGTCTDVAGSFSCACVVGFEGTRCETNTDECASRPCANDGICSDQVNGFTCVCGAGFTGVVCESETDECAVGPCHHGGTCVLGAGTQFTCVCSAGYTGSLCQVNIDDCQSAPCAGVGSRCDDGVASYVCVCAVGLAGTNCMQNVDECASAPCFNGGTCVDALNGFTCTCASGFSGMFCDGDVNECASTPCRNGGTCTDAVNDVVCTCAAGWTGQRCAASIAECLSDPCLNGGTCVDGANAFTCLCKGGYTGAQCESDVNECASSPCAAGATCLNMINAFSCTCVAGMTGPMCDVDIDECASSPCMSGGTCAQQSGALNSYVCTCMSGFAGSMCETNINDCASQPCESGGICNDGVDSYTCDCSQVGRGGTHCETVIDACTSNPCDNGGQCTATGTTLFVCACGNSGFTGVTCSDAIDECASTPCQNGASCVDGTASHTCVCAAGYEGTLCATNTDECASTPCLNGATCTDGVASVVCTCASGFTGTTCDANVLECASTPCLNGGVCTDAVDGFTCACLSGFTGILCANDVDECASSPCQFGGTCTDGEDKFTCACTSGRIGVSCETTINDCVSSPCQNGGNCVSGAAGTWSCSCAAGYTGASCENNINECASMPCANGGQCADKVNGFTCTCVAGYTGSACLTNINDCTSTPCQNGGSCQDGVASYTCVCVVGYAGTMCETDVDDCATAQCASSATCVDAVNAYTCTCAAGTTGTLCTEDVLECASFPCSNGATCHEGANTFTCSCAAGFTGALCDVNINDCLSVTCQNGGTCNDGLTSFVCACANGYTGLNCETNINECVPLPCSNGGTCTDGIGSFVCACREGFTGTSCSAVINNCLSNPCASGSTCTSTPTSYTCACVEGKIGSQCELVGVKSTGGTIRVGNVVVTFDAGVFSSDVQVDVTLSTLPVNAQIGVTETPSPQTVVHISTPSFSGAWGGKAKVTIIYTASPTSGTSWSLFYSTSESGPYTVVSNIFSRRRALSNCISTSTAACGFVSGSGYSTGGVPASGTSNSASLSTGIVVGVVVAIVVVLLVVLVIAFVVMRRRKSAGVQFGLTQDQSASVISGAVPGVGRAETLRERKAIRRSETLNSYSGAINRTALNEDRSRGATEFELSNLGVDAEVDV